MTTINEKRELEPVYFEGSSSDDTDELENPPLANLRGSAVSLEARALTQELAKRYPRIARQSG
jgi:hypothetical protein